MGLTQEQLEELREECFAEDLAIEEKMFAWTEDEARDYFDSGGIKAPKASWLTDGAQGGPGMVPLNNGLSMPALGLGTWKSEKGAVKAAVKHAVGVVGYRHVDCASVYKNEEEVGEALSELIAEGAVAREQLWITSKLWNDAHAPDQARASCQQTGCMRSICHACICMCIYAQVRASCQKTLADLKLEKLDLYLVHWPVTNTAGKEVTPA